MIRKKNIAVAAFAAAFALAVLFLLFSSLRPDSRPLLVSGRVEADEILLSARIPGRLKEVLIADGQRVVAGALVGLIDDDELRSKRRELLGRKEELSARIQSARYELEYTSNRVLNSIEEARRALNVADSRWKQARAKRDLAQRELQRYTSLLDREVVTQQKFDTVRLTLTLSEQEEVSAAQELERARVGLQNAENSRKLVKAAEQGLIALTKTLDQLEESLKQIEINLGYTRITAPIAGIILRKTAEPGEVVTTGGVVGVMIDPASVYVKTYVPERHIGRIRLGMSVDVLTDAYPGESFKGSICYISDESEFTPKEVQSYEERVKQMFALKVCFPPREDSSAAAPARQDPFKKGMPVDVQFPFSRE